MLFSHVNENDEKKMYMYIRYRQITLNSLNEGSKSGDYEEIREKQFTKLLSNGSLLLQNVKEDREGFYLCQAHNGIGSGISKVIQLKVNCTYITLMFSMCVLHFKFVSCNPIRLPFFFSREIEIRKWYITKENVKSIYSIYKYISSITVFLGTIAHCYR